MENPELVASAEVDLDSDVESHPNDLGPQSIGPAQTEVEKIMTAIKPQQEPYQLCDLCNIVVATSTEAMKHERDEHAEVARVFSRDYVARAAPQPIEERGRDKDILQTLGHTVLHSLLQSDGGEAMFDAIRRATEQMNGVMKMMEDPPHVFLFGSCVTMGIWDGVGDGDFTVLLPRVLSGEKELNRSEEKSLLLKVGKALRAGGLKFGELEMVLGSRTPVIKRRRESSRPYSTHNDGLPYRIVLKITDENVITSFKDEHVATYGGVQQRGKNSDTRAYSFANGADALRMFQHKEKRGIIKMWDTSAHMPEVYGVDFDMSCRAFGVRNSWLLRQYMEQSPLFRVGNLFIKRWSKAVKVNHSRHGYLTSYAMSILWIYYLLRAKEATFMDPSKISAMPTLEKLSVPYMPLWPESEMGEENLCELGELVRGFFRFYTFDFDWTTEVVSLCKDPLIRATTRAELDWEADLNVDSLILSSRTFYGMSILDVYEENLNLGRHLSPIKQQWVLTQFRQAFDACCDIKDHGALLRDKVDYVHEEIRVLLNRFLVAKEGRATVKEIRDHLLAEGGDRLLPSFLMHHSLSDLWCDEQLQAAKSMALFKAGRDKLPTVAPFIITQEAWVPMCDSRRVPVDAGTEEDMQGKIVFLAHAKVNFAKHPTPQTKDEEDETKKAMRAIKKEFSTTKRILDEDVAAAAVGLVLDSIRDPFGDVRGLFFCTRGDRVFLTYDSRAAFDECAHRIALKTVVSSRGSILRAIQRTNGHGDGKAAREQLISVVTHDLETNGVLVRHDLVDAIVRSDIFFKVGMLRGKESIWPTAFLEEYAGKDEGMTNRRSCGRTAWKAKNENSRYQQRPSQRAASQSRSTRDTSKRTIGRCDQCRRNNVKVFPAVQVNLDRGKYCLSCWDKY